MSNKIIQHMKAKHIKKLRAQIKHYYARSATGLFGIYTGKSDIWTKNILEKLRTTKVLKRSPQLLLTR